MTTDAPNTSPSPADAALLRSVAEDYDIGLVCTEDRPPLPCADCVSTAARLRALAEREAVGVTDAMVETALDAYNAGKRDGYWEFERYAMRRALTAAFGEKR